MVLLESLHMNQAGERRRARIRVRVQRIRVWVLATSLRRCLPEGPTLYLYPDSALGLGRASQSVRLPEHNQIKQRG
jgi:hypothetical protein